MTCVEAYKCFNKKVPVTLSHMGHETEYAYIYGITYKWHKNTEVKMEVILKDKTANSYFYTEPANIKVTNGSVDDYV